MTSQSDVEKMAAKFATLHETRLVRGECMPVASSLYISMLEAIKSIAWHASGVVSARAVAQITIEYEIVQSYNNCINHNKGRQ